MVLKGAPVDDARYSNFLRHTYPKSCLNVKYHYLFTEEMKYRLIFVKAAFFYFININDTDNNKNIRLLLLSEIRQVASHTILERNLHLNKSIL